MPREFEALGLEVGVIRHATGSLHVGDVLQLNFAFLQSLLGKLHRLRNRSGKKVSHNYCEEDDSEAQRHWHVATLTIKICDEEKRTMLYFKVPSSRPFWKSAKERDLNCIPDVPLNFPICRDKGG